MNKKNSLGPNLGKKINGYDLCMGMHKPIICVNIIKVVLSVFFFFFWGGLN